MNEVFTEVDDTFLITRDFTNGFSKEALCILVSKDQEEQASELSYSFEYLGLILELFQVFSNNFEFYSFSAPTGEASSKKIKMNIRQDDFLREHHLTELTELGKVIHQRISEWNKRYMGMSFNQGGFCEDFLWWLLLVFG